MVMTEEERFRFDLTGFLVRPSVLSADEVAALREQVDRVFDDWKGLPPEQRLPAGAWLIDHPQVRDVLHEVVGPDIRLEGMLPVRRARGNGGNRPLHQGGPTGTMTSTTFRRSTAQEGGAVRGVGSSIVRNANQAAEP